MLFAIVIYGCFLGWFRFFRVSNLYLAFNSFSAQKRHPAYAGVLYILLYLICFALVFDIEAIQNVLRGAGAVETGTEASAFSLSKFTYFTVSVIFGEICRAINNIEDDSPADNNDGETFMDLLTTLSPEYYTEGSLEHLIGDETCAAIEVSSWLYGVRSDVRRSLIFSISKEYNVSRFYRPEVLDYFNLQTGTNHAAKRAIKKIIKKHGKGTTESKGFLEIIAKIGKRSGFSISDVTQDLTKIGILLGVTEDDIKLILKRASKTSTDNDFRDYKEAEFWSERENYQKRRSQNTYSQQDYSQQDYSRENSSRYEANTQSLNERQKALKVLGVSEDATEKDIRTAYRKLAMKYHPDRVHADGGTEADVEKATEKMSTVNRAYDYLCV